MHHAVSIAVFVAGAIAVLSLLDADAAIGSIFGGLGLIGLAIGFAVRDTLENYLASLLLSLRQPFAPGDLVDIDQTTGRVARMTTRATVLLDPDGNHVRVPNAQVFKARIVNYDRNSLRRFEFAVGIDPAASVAAVRQLIRQAIAATPGVSESPPPAVVFLEFGDWANLLSCRGWVDQSEADFELTRTAAMSAVKNSLEQAGIDMPVPTHRISRVAACVGSGPDQDKHFEEVTAPAEVRHEDPIRDFAEQDVGEDLLSPDAQRE